MNSFSAMNKAIDYEISRQVLLHNQSQERLNLAETETYKLSVPTSRQAAYTQVEVLYLLRKYLGEYVEGFSLRISVWKGELVLKDLRFKAEAQNLLNLPVAIKAGFIGTMTLQVPWKSFGKAPIIVLIDRIFVLAEPTLDEDTLRDEHREKLFESKLKQIEEAESATIDAAIMKDKARAAPSGGSWLGSLLATIIGNLKFTISNVHIKYEDSISNPGHPFCSGITLSKLAPITTDEQGNETFDASGVLDKSFQLLQLAVYHDCESAPWNLDNSWEDLKSVDCTEIFQDEIDGSRTASLWAKDRRYLLSPINGVLKYHCLGNQERQNPQIRFAKASLVLSDVYFTVSEAQYYDGIKLLEALSRYETRVEVSHLRPVVPVLEDAHAWWLYAMLASLRQKKLCYWFSWERMKHHCQLRRLYIQMYSTFLQQTSNVDIYAMRKIERILDSKVILLWRLLAHAKLELVGAMERSWWSFGWRSTSSGLSINELLSCEPQRMRRVEVDEVEVDEVGVEVEVEVDKVAARISGISQTEIVFGSFEHLNLITEMPGQSVRWDVSLKCHDSSSPEAQLSQSVSS